MLHAQPLTLRRDELGRVRSTVKEVVLSDNVLTKEQVCGCVCVCVCVCVRACVCIHV